MMNGLPTWEKSQGKMMGMLLLFTSRNDGLVRTNQLIILVILFINFCFTNRGI